MAQTTLERPMAKPTESVKLETDVVADARIAAGYAGKTVGKYLSDILRPIVERDIKAGHARRFGKQKPDKPE